MIEPVAKEIEDEYEDDDEEEVDISAEITSTSYSSYETTNVWDSRAGQRARRNWSARWPTLRQHQTKVSFSI
jgi:hypothetical protein